MVYDRFWGKSIKHTHTHILINERSEWFCFGFHTSTRYQLSLISQLQTRLKLEWEGVMGGNVNTQEAIHNQIGWTLWNFSFTVFLIQLSFSTVTLLLVWLCLLLKWITVMFTCKISKPPKSAANPNPEVWCKLLELQPRLQTFHKCIIFILIIFARK